MSQPIRVVLVDDHRMFRSGVRSELAEEAADGIEIVGEAPDVETAVSVIKAEQPDVVLLDVHLPGGLGHGGVDVLRGCVAQESQRGEPIRFLALSVSDAAEDVIAVIRAGARGYVTKTINSTDLATAIRRVAEGTRSSRRGSPASCSMRSGRRRGRLPRSTRSSTGSPRASARSCGSSPGGTSTRKSPRSSSSRSRRSRRMSLRCFASSSSRRGTSSRRGRWGESSSERSGRPAVARLPRAGRAAYVAIEAPSGYAACSPHRHRCGFAARWARRLHPLVDRGPVPPPGPAV